MTAIPDRYALRKQPTQPRAQATVTAIVDAAAQLVVSTGYAKTNTNLIAELAGVSVGSLYEYFPGKEAVFAELRRRFSLHHYQLLTGHPRPETPRTMLRHLVTTHVGFVREHLSLYVALTTEVPRFAIADVEAYVLGDFIPQSEQFLSLHRQHLKPSADVQFVTEFLIRVLSSTVNDLALRSPDRLLGDEITQALYDMLDSYLLQPGAP